MQALKCIDRESHLCSKHRVHFVDGQCRLLRRDGRVLEARERGRRVGRPVGRLEERELIIDSLVDEDGLYVLIESVGLRQLVLCMM